MDDTTRNLEIKCLDDQRTYFCSELIAKALKIIGLIKNMEVSSTQYYPGCFQKGGNIEQNLIDEMQYGPEINILVDNDTKQRNEENFINEQIRQSQIEMYKSLSLSEVFNKDFL